LAARAQHHELLSSPAVPSTACRVGSHAGAGGLLQAAGSGEGLRAQPPSLTRETWRRKRPAIHAPPPNRSARARPNGPVGGGSTITGAGSSMGRERMCPPLSSSQSSGLPPASSGSGEAEGRKGPKLWERGRCHLSCPRTMRGLAAVQSTCMTLYSYKP
jgi:hypothetical protein